jgi:glutamine cyclotransferase
VNRSHRRKSARGANANHATRVARDPRAAPLSVLVAFVALGARPGVLVAFVARAARLIALGAFIASGCSCGDDDHSAPVPPPIPVYGYSVVNVYPHDTRAFTQGLALESGQSPASDAETRLSSDKKTEAPRLFESTGGYGTSTLREVELETGTVIRSIDLSPQYYGEGIVVIDTQVVQLTWQNNVGFLYGKESFAQLSTFGYAWEGWGLAYDGERLVMSDGTPTLHFLDPATFAEIGRVSVRSESLLVAGLNELEFVNGEIYANVWLTDRIAIITPETGRVRAWIDLAELLPVEDRPGADVLNGIAYDTAAGGRLFVTGKFWPSLFEIELVAP